MTRLLFILFCCMGFAACTTEDGVDYCKEHYLYHSEHLDSLGTLSISMTDDGRLTSELTLPASFSAEGLDEQLQNVGSVYSLQTVRDCAAATSSFGRQNNELIATYESQCGLDNKIGQLDVLLFDTLASLEELEVDVVTPVTQKHFAINRQCESAIFRLD